MNTQTRINIINLIIEAWQLSYGMKWPVFALGILIPLTYSLLLVITAYILVPNKLFMSLPFFIIAVAIALVIVWFTVVILVMLGVRQAIGLPISIDDVYSHCMEVKDKLIYLGLIWIAITGTFALITFMTKGSFILFPLFYCLSLYIKLPLILFGIPLVVTKHYDMAIILEECYKTMNRHWLQILASYLILSGILLISSIPLGIGLIWTIPMYFTMAGILFRDIFGLKRKKQTNE